MKIVTWNVNSIRSRIVHVLEFLRDESPDILLLQELKCLDEVFPIGEVDVLGYNVSLFGQKTYNGVAIISKYPIEDVVKGIPNFDDDQARYIECFTGGIRVASVYVPNGFEVGCSKFEYKMQFFDALFSHMENLLKFNEDAIIAGDFNVVFDEKDTHHGKLKEDRILLSPKERSKLRSLTNLGYSDILRETNIDKEQLFTWWDYRKDSYTHNLGYRIDHILASPSAADKIECAWVATKYREKNKPSDHAPVCCEIAI